MRVTGSARILMATMAVAGTAALAAPAAVAAPAVGPVHIGAPLAASWHTSFAVTGPNRPLFSAVTASSGTSAWAFGDATGRAPTAFQLTGSSWTRRAFPAQRGDFVTAASSSSSANVWAFTLKGRALRFNGMKWAAVHEFGRQIASGLAISRTDVWVFGSPGLATWHYNGHGWAKSASGKGLRGASALSASSIWAYGGTSVGHWNGKTWAMTSLARLLPKNSQLSRSFLAGIYAASAKSVWVAASGGRVDENGPLVLLHFNGSGWRRVVEAKNLGGPVAIIPDGRGGLWVPVNTGFPGNGSMEHFSRGSLNDVQLPFSPRHLALFGAATAKHTIAALAVGYSRKSFNAPTTTAVILRYGS